MILTEESKLYETKSIQNNRKEFLRKAYELSKGSDIIPVSAFGIANVLGYDQRTLKRIYFYLQYEGLIKPYAIGGDFTITDKCIKQFEVNSL